MMLRIEAGLPLDRRRVARQPRLALTDHDRVTPKELGRAGCCGRPRRQPCASSAARRSAASCSTARRAGRRPASSSTGPTGTGCTATPASCPPRTSSRSPGSSGCARTTTGEQVGYVTSFCYSPVLQRHIGIARVRPDLAAPGTELHMETRRSTTTTRTWSRSAPRRCPSSTPRGRRPMTDDQPHDRPHRHVVRRDRRRRRPQRPDQRGVPRQGRPAHAGARAARRSSAARRSPRSCVPGLLVHHVLLRAEPAAAGDHPRARPGRARLPAADDAVVFHPTGDGDYLLFGDDHEQNVQEIRRHSPHDADAYDALPPRPRPGLQAVRPLFDNPPPEHLRQATPRTRPTSPGCSTTSAASTGR